MNVENGLGPQNRLYGMMQAVLTVYAQNSPHPGAPAARGAVSEQDALDALMHLAASIDAMLQQRRITAADALMMGSWVVLAREYIKPVPEGVAEEGGPDLVTADLEAVLAQLHEGQRIAFGDEAG